MVSSWRSRIGHLLIGALAATACAQQRSAINRVQADALAKSFFVGNDLASTADDPEFYRRGTLVDVGYGAAQEGLFTSTYAQPVSRVRWEITEDSLNARLSYEQISGTDDKGNQYTGVGDLKAANDGQIVATYKILSHFDIKRDYNPQTGEQLNIIDENTTDRPWYEREYFRVDWSQNLVTDSYGYDTLAMTGVIGGVKYDPFAYTVLDPSSPDAPHFSPSDGYFDVTVKAYATPQQLDLSAFGGTGTIPACLLPAAFVSGGTDPYGNCNPIELTIRESYRRVVDDDYEPASFDGVRFQAIGAFNFSYRRGYAQNYGLVDQEWSRFISRYNIWDRSHFYADPTAMTGPIACATKATTEDPTGDPDADPNRDLDGNGTADECQAAGAGARCDVFTQKCTLPYRDRKVRTIPWYVAGDATLFDPTNWAVVEWDLAMKTAVETARLVECRKTNASGCDTTFPMWTGQQDDNDEAVRIARDVDACRRTQGWSATACANLASTEAAALATERGVAGDPGPLASGPIAAMPPVIVLCHNPTSAADHPACGGNAATATGAPLAPRLGDIRYNQVLAVPDPQTPSPWGIMVDGDDPLTGEKVVGSMNIWTAVTDLAAQQLVDLVRYINGEIPTAQITNGTYIQSWVGAAKLGAGRELPTMSRTEIDRRLAASTTLALPDFQALAAATPGPEVQAAIDAGKAAALDVQTSNQVASPGQAQVQATMSLGRGTDVETQLINPAILQLAGAPVVGTLAARAQQPARAVAVPADARQRAGGAGRVHHRRGPRAIVAHRHRRHPGQEVPERAQRDPGRAAGPLRQHVPLRPAQVPLRGHRARDGTLDRIAPQLRQQLGAAVLPAAVLAAPHQERPAPDPMHRRGRRRLDLRGPALL